MPWKECILDWHGESARIYILQTSSLLWRHQVYLSFFICSIKETDAYVLVPATLFHWRKLPPNKKRTVLFWKHVHVLLVPEFCICNLEFSLWSTSSPGIIIVLLVIRSCYRTNWIYFFHHFFNMYRNDCLNPQLNKLWPHITWRLLSQLITQ